MAPLFSKVDSNKLWQDVQHEENMLFAQFGKDLFNISKVIGRKKVAQFFDSQCRCVVTVIIKLLLLSVHYIAHYHNKSLLRSMRCVSRPT